jgi:hypothetical protein
MRALASCGAVVTRSAILATLVTLVGCGGSQANLRRPLVTDQTPLGAPRATVDVWYAENGWCGGRREAPGWQARGIVVEQYSPCKGPDHRRITALLFFDRDERLAMASVYVLVPPDDSPATEEPLYFGVAAPAIGVRYEPGSVRERPRREALRRRPREVHRDRSSSDMGLAVLDALAFEIEARHGEGERPAPVLRWWTTNREVIYMHVEGPWVIETHARKSPLRSAPPPSRERPGALAESD